MQDVQLRQFTCYCVDIDPGRVRQLMRLGRWRELELLGIGHICTGCRADYKLLKSTFKRDELPATK